MFWSFGKACLKEYQKEYDYKQAFHDFVIGLEVWVPKALMNLPIG